MTAFLVLLAGTGADHRHTKWSAKACEEYAGMGKPRAKAAIVELMAAGLVEHVESSTRLFPHYRLAEPTDAADPIFLPVSLVTGIGTETPILRRVRQTGDDMLLRMLLDLYGLIETDLAFGVPLQFFRQYAKDVPPAEKVMEIGANTIWALPDGDVRNAAGAWRSIHDPKAKKVSAEDHPFWPRVKTLERVGALVIEPWVFDGEPWDAEPLFPLTPFPASDAPQVEMVRDLRQAMHLSAQLMAGDRGFILDQHQSATLVVLPSHHRPPALRGVFKLRLEADWPGRRAAYAKRLTAIEAWTNGYKAIAANAADGRHSKPIQPLSNEREEAETGEDL